MAQPIQTRLKLLFGKSEVDITEDITPDLLDFSFEDKETNEAEEISIKLKDETGKWGGRWKPDGGEVIKAYIMQGNIKKATKTLYCGKFYVDELSISGAPRVVEMKAVSIPLNKPIRKRVKTVAWEKKNLKDIAEEIAKQAELTLLFDSDENPEYDREDQNRESDLKFLSRLCEDAGLSLKITDEKLVIFNQASYEKKAPVQTLTIGESDILSYSFTASQSETYKSVKVKYLDSKTGSFNEYTYTDESADENGQEYTLKQRAVSIADAIRLARAKLRYLNLRQTTGSMTLIGDVSLLSGCVVTCKGIGAIDGNFIIESATHSVGSGYTTAINLRRVNNYY